MKTRRPRPEERCTRHNNKGRQCANWRYQGHLTCRRHTPGLPQKTNPNRAIAANNKNRYKNGTRAAPLKPLRHPADLWDELTIKHYEFFLAAETAAEEENLHDLAHLSTKLINTTRRFIKTLKK
jgi:hypothetical protein